MKGFYRQNIELIKTNISAILWFELLYKMLVALVLYPLILMCLDYAIEHSGLTFLAAKNLNTFLMNPVSLAIGASLLMVMVLFSLYELSVLTICFEASRVGKKVNVIEIAYAGLTKMRMFLHPVGFLFFFVLLAAVTFLGLPFASAMVSVTGIPDYLRNSYQESRVLYYVVVITSAVVLWFFWSYIFAIHYIVLRNLKFKEAMAATRRLIRGRLLGINARFLVWYLIVFTSLFAVYTLVLFAGAAITSLLPEDTGLIAFLTLSRVVGNGTSFLLYSFFTPVFFVVVSNYFSRKSKERTNEDEEVRPVVELRSFKSHRVVLGLILVLMMGANIGILARSFSEGVIRQLIFARTPDITAHRGSSASAPENTLASVERAIEENADFAEIDVRMTSDGEVVLMHDANLERTTGTYAIVWDRTWDSLAELDAGSHFSDEYTGEKIPLLEDVIDAASGRIRLNIEVKASLHTPDLPRKVAELIVEKEFGDQCVVTSFNYDALAKIKRVDPDIRTGLIITMPLGRYTHLEYADFYSLNASFLSARQVDMIHRLGYDVHAWGVRDERMIQRMVEYGVDNIIAPDPIMAREAVYTQSANELVILLAEVFFGQNDVVRRGGAFFPIRYEVGG
ncbi:MAG: glycerophosphoryl diester phosphodiesterase membrane domain-containing protein [Clostridiales bacterium]|nr:glycerophosphoryl diester phosphodiesterase membrane domain-containing protein [Clostridiales bacterium]